MGIFFKNRKPLITAMISESTPKDILSIIGKGIADGAEAFGLQIEFIEPIYRTQTVFKEIFSAMEGRPAYITNYRRNNRAPNMTDDELTEEMLTAVSCGAKLFDVRGDLFCISPDEITENDDAVEKQKQLIDSLHAMGTEVLMSSHVFRYITPEKALRIAEAQQFRGADIAKIVAEAGNQSELFSNFETTLLLKRKLHIDSLFLCNGISASLHRRFAPLLGAGMVLCVINDAIKQGVHQPSVHMINQIFKIFEE